MSPHPYVRHLADQLDAALRDDPRVDERRVTAVGNHLGVRVLLRPTTTVIRLTITKDVDDDPPPAVRCLP